MGSYLRKWLLTTTSPIALAWGWYVLDSAPVTPEKDKQ